MKEQGPLNLGIRAQEMNVPALPNNSRVQERNEFPSGTRFPEQNEQQYHATGVTARISGVRSHRLESMTTKATSNLCSLLEMTD